MIENHYVYARVNAAEFAAAKKAARARGLSMSNFVRRAVNGLLLDEGNDPILLEETNTQRGRPVVTDARAVDAR
jgi:hypothetical protein